jgi:hypothetical protein
MWLRNKASNRGSEISESNYGSETDAARAAQFRRVRTRSTGSAGCGCTRPIPNAGPVNRHLAAGGSISNYGTAVVRNLPPSPQQGGCGLSLASKVAAPRLAEPSRALALNAPAGKAPSSALQGRALTPASGPGLPTSGGTQAGRGACHFAGGVEHHGPGLRLVAMGGSEPQLPCRTLPESDRHGGWLPACCSRRRPSSEYAGAPGRALLQRGPGLVQLGRALQQRTRGPPRGVQHTAIAGESSGHVPTRSLSWAARTCAAKSVHRVQRRASRAAQQKNRKRARRVRAPMSTSAVHARCSARRHPLVPSLHCDISSRHRMADGYRCHVACTQRVIIARATVPVACSPSGQQPSTYP